jgi:hypothetical protein
MLLIIGGCTGPWVHSGYSIEEQLTQIGLASLFLVIGILLFGIFLHRRLRMKTDSIETPIYKNKNILQLETGQPELSSIPVRSDFPLRFKLVGLILIVIFLFLHSEYIYFPFSQIPLWW